MIVEKQDGLDMDNFTDRIETATIIGTGRSSRQQINDRPTAKGMQGWFQQVWDELVEAVQRQ